jgi:S1-C subfamily serine protease
VGDDVALLQLDDASGMKTISVGNPTTVSSGDAVVAIGNALGRFNAPSAVGGTVTALHQSITAGDGAEQESLADTIRFNGAIRPGDSGGALVDQDGRVIGMNTAADTGQDRFGESAGTTGFAIPISTAIGIAEQIRHGDESNGVHIGKRALLGVGLGDGSENPPFSDSSSGAEVAQVGSDTPADRAGMAEGDTIVRVDRRSIGSNDDLRAALDRHHPGDKVTVRWVDQDGNVHRAAVTLSEGPPA